MERQNWVIIGVGRGKGREHDVISKGLAAVIQELEIKILRDSLRGKWRGDLKR